MEGSNPPQLPPPLQLGGAIDEHEGFTTLDAVGIDSHGLDTLPARLSAATEPLSVDEFLAALEVARDSSVTEDAPTQEVHTMLRLLFGAPLADVGAVCRALIDAHQLDYGVAVEDDRELVLVLPTGVPWNSAVQTVCRVEPMLKQSVYAGLADFQDSAESALHAVELSKLGAQRAAEAGQPACMLDLDTLLVEEERMRQEAEVAAALLQSLRSGTGLRLVYQPKYDSKSNEMIGAEALLRFQCDHLGALGPAEFLPIAERAGLLSQVERWVLDAGIAAIAEWQREGLLSFPVSLNVVPEDFFREGFVAELDLWLKTLEADPSLVRLELPERGLKSQAPEAVRDRLAEVRSLGLSVVLDDVGEDDAQLTGIRGLEIDGLKVHRSLILQMAFCDSTSAVVRGILSLARALEIDTVAAGVETELQLQQLRDFGCNAVQGYLLSRPVEAAAFGEMLRASKPSAK